MDLKKYISYTYPTVTPYEGINSVENALLEHQYLVVIDNNEEYQGILTIPDLIKRPHKIVIDCVTKKENLRVGDTIMVALDKFRSSRSSVLPIMSESKFIGVIEKNKILSELQTKTKNLQEKSLISEKAKQNFLDNLSHEIRTPLNGILGLLDIITQLEITDHSAEHDLLSRSLRKSADQFLIIMSDLVDLALINAGDEMSPQIEELDISEFFSELKDHFNDLISVKYNNKIIKYKNDFEHFTIRTDRRKLQRILYHLVNNALKFSEEKEVIFGFNVNKDKNYLSFFVKNKKLNVDQKDIEKMFEVFEKQEHIGKELNFGLGIGLPLVKNLTELLGGQVEVKLKNSIISFIINIPF